MRVLTEDVSARPLTDEIALAARVAFLAARQGVTFPVLVAHGSDPGNRFTVKSRTTDASAGLKIGSYWPGNPGRELSRHSSDLALAAALLAAEDARSPGPAR